MRTRQLFYLKGTFPMTPPRTASPSDADRPRGIDRQDEQLLIKLLKFMNPTENVHGALSGIAGILDEHLCAERASAAANEQRVKGLEQLVCDFQASAMLDINGDPDGITPAHIEREVTALRSAVAALESQLAALTLSQQDSANKLAAVEKERDELRAEVERLRVGRPRSPEEALEATRKWQLTPEEIKELES
jgi:chromosome segregation ATPase